MKKLFFVLAALSFLGSAAFPAFAAEYPNKPITLVIQYPAGGSTDLTARALANGARKYLGQPIICENKAGGGGTVGVALVAAKPADGYTIGIVTSSPTMAYHMGKLNFHPLNDLTPIMRWGNYLFGITVRSDAQWKTIQEVLQYAKQNPEKLSYGSPGVGTPPHLAMEELSGVAGLKFTHIPAKGIAENNTALLGGHIDLISDSSGWAPLVDAGKFKLIATWGEKRCAKYPQVPTIKEVGYDVVARSHLGVIGPKNMPKPIVAKLADAFTKALEDPEFKAVMTKFDMENYYLSTDDYTKYMKTDFENIGKLVKKLGLDKQ
ncbi:MAG TPA: tripartite tricarboxylate transporter substrate binding protein [Thermodesulfobacteriota bacterium]|nr:tripartite tricarboxylate transporter substrate binding protein [Thermodesulfobacteriota bacterium]